MPERREEEAKSREYWDTGWRREGRRRKGGKGAELGGAILRRSGSPRLAKDKEERQRMPGQNNHRRVSLSASARGNKSEGCGSGGGTKEEGRREGAGREKRRARLRA